MLATNTTSRPLRWAAIMACIIFAYIIVVEGKTILMPLVVSGFIAIIIQPLVIRLENWKFPRPLAIGTILLILVLFLPLIGFVLFKQGAAIARDLPEITDKLTQINEGFLLFIDSRLGISTADQTEIFNDGFNQLMSSGGAILQSTFSATVNMLAYIALIPVFVFLMLLYRERFRKFIVDVSDRNTRKDVDLVIDNGMAVVQNYVAGLTLVVLIMAVMNVAGLLLLGIPYALFFGVLAALLAVIPYIGVIIGSIPPVLIAILMTDSLMYPLGVIILFIIVQALEGNIITPKVIGDKVSINPLAAIVALITGGFIWGAIGMILAIPITGVIKVIVNSMHGGRPISELLS